MEKITNFIKKYGSIIAFAISLFSLFLLFLAPAVRVLGDINNELGEEYKIATPFQTIFGLKGSNITYNICGIFAVLFLVIGMIISTFEAENINLNITLKVISILSLFLSFVLLFSYPSTIKKIKAIPSTGIISSGLFLIIAFLIQSVTSLLYILPIYKNKKDEIK